jgi:hypothetical protein
MFSIVCIVSSIFSYGEVYLIQHYVIMFVSDLQQVSGLLWVLRFPLPIKLTSTTYILLKVTLNTITITLTQFMYYVCIMYVLCSSCMWHIRDVWWLLSGIKPQSCSSCMWHISDVWWLLSGIKPQSCSSCMWHISDVSGP